MSLSPTIPDLYRYGILASRAIGVLSKSRNQPISEEEKEVLGESQELVRKMIRGEQFLFGSKLNEMAKIRPEDVEAFTFVLSSDAQVKNRAAKKGDLRVYFEHIVSTLESAIAPVGPPDPEAIQIARDFFARFADSLIEMAKEKRRRAAPAC